MSESMVWSLIPGWPGYRVSSTGRVQSRRTPGGFDSGEWNDRQPAADKDGYQKIRLHQPDTNVTEWPN